MEILFALVVAILAAVGVYLTLSRTILRLVLGLTFVAYAANLAILSAGGLSAAAPPLLSIRGPYVDPLPQALILTAIVIGFGTTALLLTLAVRTYQATGRDDVAGFDDELNELEALPELRADPEHPTNPEELSSTRLTTPEEPVVGPLREQS
ncbi:sodium:proton antiporter [Deinococcus peraridilitoris]|uniref:Multisubunit Na+/H+ antiporter, MnhC subunit n=1 Tax=Deinococcus peraridilitoris (strain DSM 19664 / LMG 22246 / CIP 109416 / KR-200) TaxID=937777 RepID=K9ZZP1_DEIPD|nr:NADH-quinone oxidoreductase subunit K [Deinococcus peraridilitoris]AFZ66649.1 multisubunit Na+/H+ antiporter, MnhC subunit [Deinococcus peraridilitoris DSM 19664]